jgi:hypothetical protein
MSYRYNRNYRHNLPKSKSSAYHADGAANDEGFYFAYCQRCGHETEHGITEGCCSCPIKRKK